MIDRRAFVRGIGVAGIGAAVPQMLRVGAPGGDARRSEKLLGEVSEQLLVEYPDDATFLGLDTGPRSALHGAPTDRTIARDSARAASCATRLARMKAIDASGLSGIEAVDLEATIYAHKLADEGYRRFRYGDNAVLNVWQAESNSPYAVSQGTGFFATIPDFLDSVHKIETVGDAEAYLSRLSAFARGLDGETERLKRDASIGSIAPDFLLDTTLAQQTGYRAKPVATWGLVTSLANRAKQAGVTGDWSGRAQRLCETEVEPAIDRQIAALQMLRTRATHDAGCWKLPDGDAYYRWLLRVGTTTTMSPDEVHALGIDQVHRIGSEMDRLLQAQGLTQGSVGRAWRRSARTRASCSPTTSPARHGCSPISTASSQPCERSCRRRSPP